MKPEMLCTAEYCQRGSVFLRAIQGLWLGSVLWLLSPTAMGGDGGALSFGVVPQQSATKLAQAWAPLLRYLGEHSGHTVRFATAKDIPTFEQQLADGRYDFAYMNPYHYVVFHQKPGYLAIAKESNRRLTGIVVVRKDARYQTMQELNGKTVAFPAPAAFAATVLPLAHAAKQGIALKPKFVASHESVYLAVAQGLYPAGGGVVRTFEAMPEDTRGQLRVLWTTDGYTPHAIAVHPRVPRSVVERLWKAMLSLNTEPRGKALLEAVHFKGIERAHDTDWNDVRALQINQLDHLLHPAN